MDIQTVFVETEDAKNQRQGYNVSYANPEMSGVSSTGEDFIDNNYNYTNSIASNGPILEIPSSPIGRPITTNN